MGRLATGNRRISLELLGAAAFMVIADARVIDPVLHIIATGLSTRKSGLN